MRRRVARQRDTLDPANLPRGPQAELCHRTSPYDPRTDLLHALFVIGWQVALSLALVLPTNFLAYIPIPAVSSIFVPFIAWQTFAALVAFLRTQSSTKKLAWGFVFALSWGLFELLSWGPSARQSYLVMFGPAVLATAAMSHVIARQFAFWMTVNVRLEKPVVDRWQGYWGYIARPVTPDGCPEIESYRVGFLALGVAYVAGYLALVWLERTPLAPYAGLLSLAAFALAALALWALWSASGIVPRRDPGRVLAVAWRGIVNWYCYNRHQTIAPGVFQFPTALFRRMLHRYLATLVPLCLLTLSVWQMEAGQFSDFVHGVSEDIAAAHAALEVPLGTEEEASAMLTPAERAWADRLGNARRRYLDEKTYEHLDEQAEEAIPGWTQGVVVRFAAFFLACTAGSVGLFVVIFATATGRLLAAYHDALEAPDATEVEPGASAWDNRVQRLLNSKNPLEREHVYLGRSVYGDYPVLLHLPLLHQHAHILGDTGSRKTSVGISPLLTQLIARADASVLVLDLKGDRGLFECARIEAERAGLPFKYFTNIGDRSSHVFNPLRQSHSHRLNIHQRTQAILQALSLEYGEGYGEGFYSAINEIVLKEYLDHYKTIGSLRQLLGYVKDSHAYKGLGGVHDDWKNARHLAILIDKLSSVYPMNLTEEDVADRPGAWAERIDMPDMLETKQVVYFHLSSSLEPTTVSPVARLAMFNLLSAAAPLEGRGNRVYIFIDEFQRIVTENVRLFLEQARSMRLHFILANQTMGQLKGTRRELVDTVESCTAYKHLFKATDLETLLRLEQASGEALYHENQWQLLFPEGCDPRADADYGDDAARRVQTREALGPRLERNTLIELSAASWLSLVRFTEGSGYTQYSGYFTPIVHEFHISQDEYRRRTEGLAWPEAAGTVMKPAEDIAEPPPAGRARSVIDRLDEHAGRPTIPPHREERHEPTANEPA